MPHGRPNLRSRLHFGHNNDKGEIRGGRRRNFPWFFFLKKDRGTLSLTLNDISARHAVGLYWVPGHAGVRVNETAGRLAQSGSASGFVGPKPALGVSKRDLSNKIGRWLVNQHQRWCQDLGPSQRQARELISWPNWDTRAKFLSLSREQSRVVTRLLTRHNTLCRHLHLMGLRDSPLCRKCGAEDETSDHILRWCEALASIRHAHLGSFFLESEDIKRQNLGAIWRFSKAAGLLWGNDWGTKGRLI
jgi:hypothetical protein